MKVDSFTCPRCLATSCNPHDIRFGYCGACHDWTGEASPLLAAARAMEYQIPISEACRVLRHSRCAHPSYSRRGDGCECACHGSGGEC